MIKLLFVCTENRLRSPTGEEVFSAYPGVQAIGCGTNSDAETPLSGDLIEWADVILAMEKSHKNKVAKKYRELLKNKRLVCIEPVVLCCTNFVRDKRVLIEARRM